MLICVFPVALWSKAVGIFPVAQCAQSDVPSAVKLIGPDVSAPEPVREPEGGAAVTDRLTVAVWVRLPDTPVMVTVLVPTAAPLLAVNVSKLELVAGLVPNEAVTPEGSPEALRVTLPLNPPTGLTVIVLVPVAACTMVTLAGAAERLKSGAVGVAEDWDEFGPSPLPFTALTT